MTSDKKYSPLFFIRKTIVSPTYSDLYDYAANNPVHYIDPDGNQVAMPSPYGIPIIVPINPVVSPDNKKRKVLDDGVISKDGSHLLNNKNNDSEPGEKLQYSASAPCPNPEPNNNDDDKDDEKLTPEDIDKYNKDVKEKYKDQLDNSNPSTETPWNPSSSPDSSGTPPNLQGWKKIIYFLGKMTELFDNINN